jgi:hypothetical protein
MTDPITLQCKISFNNAEPELSTIHFMYEDIPIEMQFDSLFNVNVDVNGDGDAILRSANLYVNEDKTICSLFDIRDYAQSGRFAVIYIHRETISEGDYEDSNSKTRRIIRELTEASENNSLKLAVPFNNLKEIISRTEASVDRPELYRLYLEDYNKYYSQADRSNDNKISQIFHKLDQIFPGADVTRLFRGFRGGRRKNCHRSCHTRYKAKRVKHAKSKKRYRKSKKRMHRS